MKKYLFLLLAFGLGSFANAASIKVHVLVGSDIDGIELEHNDAYSKSDRPFCERLAKWTADSLEEFFQSAGSSVQSHRIDVRCKGTAFGTGLFGYRIVGSFAATEIAPTNIEATTRLLRSFASRINDQISFRNPIYGSGMTGPFELLVTDVKTSEHDSL